MDPLRDWRTSYLVLVLVWGSNFALIALALDAFTPVQIAAARMVIGCAVVTSVAVLQRLAWPREWRVWMHCAISGVMTGAVPCTLVPLAERSISSVAAGALNATAPLFTVLAWIVLARIGRPNDDPFRVRRAVPGVLLAFVGVGVFALGQPLGRVAALGFAFAVAAAAAHGVGAAYVRRWLAGTATSGLVISAIQPAASAVVLVPLLPVEPAPSDVQAAPLLALLSLGALSSGLAYVLYMRIIRAAGPTTAISVMFVMPVVSTLLGVTLLDEHLSATMLVGMVIALAGVVLSSRASAAVRSAPR